MGTSSGEKNSRFGRSVTLSNLPQGTVSASEDTQRSEKCTPTHIQQTPREYQGPGQSKKKKGFRECQYHQKKKTVNQKEESSAENTKNFCSKFPLEEGSK